MGSAKMSAVLEVRAMRADDVDTAEGLWDDAFEALRARFALPVIPRTATSVAQGCARLRHFLRTDPAGAFVAAVDDQLVGLALGLRRGDLFVLAQFAVAPAAQGQGVGRAVLHAAVAYGADLPRGMIICSRDPAAMRRYFTAGFDLHPSFAAYGAVRLDRLPATPGVRVGSPYDLGLVAAVDVEVRGAAHGDDITHALHSGATLLVHEDGGYVLIRERPMLLAARTDAIATELLAAAFAQWPAGTPIDMSWITAEQQWAIRLVLDAGLELIPHGPVALRGFARAPAPYLPNGAFG
jgi:GNAT superfamily N-acetyltransferase